MGNRLRHAYDQSDATILWNVVNRTPARLEGRRRGRT
ncbi:MAG: hypothetical protein JSS43_33150 [Proteobacteria bacterium]|nr:hypothetical protein [Pseudomonadota bacterium]